MFPTNTSNYIPDCLLTGAGLFNFTQRTTTEVGISVRVLSHWLLLLAILLLSLAADSFAGDILVAQFSGLNSQDTPATLEPTAAQDLLNVNITPGGRSVYKRDGYALYQTLTYSTSAIHGAHYFQDTAGANIQLWGNDRYLSTTVGGATPILLATGTLAATWQCADSFGLAYCLSSSRDTPVRTGGAAATTTRQAGIPLGTMVTSTPDRLVVAGVSGSETTLFFSQANTFGNFVVGINSADPFTEPIQSPGSRITHIRYACGKVLWWKDASFGYSIGSDQYNLEDVVISPNIGSLDNSSDEYNGHVYFRGQDNHIYDYDCANVTRLSRAISPTVTASGRRISNSWTLASAAAFSDGTTSTTTILSSGVEISTENANPTDNSFELTQWSALSGSGFTMGSPATTSSCVSVAKDGSYVAGYQNAAMTSCTIGLYDASSGSSLGTTSVTYVPGACIYAQRTITVAGSRKAYVRLRITCGTDALQSPSFTGSGATTVTFWTRSDTIASTRIMEFDFFQGGKTTLTEGVYFSPVKNAPSLNAWDTFSASKTDGGGTHAFFLRSAANTFTIGSSTPAWNSIPNNSGITIATGTYFQWKDSFTVTAASANPTVQSVTVSWLEGTSTDKAYIKYFNDCLWVSVSSGTSGLNNRVQRWDLQNETWLLDDIAANGFIVDNNNLYFGDPSAGKIYRYGGNLNTDNSASISAYWKSKDFTGADPFVQNTFDSADFIVKQASGTTLTVTYAVDGSTATSYSLNLYDNGRSIVRRGTNLPGRIGNFINIKFGDTSSNTRWEVLGTRFRYTPLAWRPN